MVVSDGTYFDSETITVSVNEVNTAPFIDSIEDQQIDGGSALEITVTASDQDGDSLSFVTYGLPSFAIFTDNGDGTATISATTTCNDTGVYSIAAVVFDDGDLTLSDGQAFLLTVTECISTNNQRPTIDEINILQIKGGTTIEIIMAGSDLDGNNLTFSTTNIPSFATLIDNDDGTANLRIAPSCNDVGTYLIHNVVLDDGSPRLKNIEEFTLEVTECAELFCGRNIDDFDSVIRQAENISYFEGTPDDDLIFGSAENDRIDAQDGNDCILGGPGNDKIFGGNGDDVIYGGEGQDSLNGGSGDDKLFGDSGDDRLHAGSGGYYDELDGGQGKDRCIYDSRDIEINCER